VRLSVDSGAARSPPKSESPSIPSMVHAMNLKERIRRILETQETPAGRWVDGLIQCLILFSLVCFSLETLPSIGPRFREFLTYSEVIVVLIFTVEYILRVATTEKPLKYIFSFLGIIDLLAILPYYLTIGIDLRAVRIFRILRIIRFFKLPKYNKAIRRMQTAFRLAREDLVMFSAVAFILFYVSAVGIYYFEHEAQPEAYASVFHSMWWSVVTLTTVGYGDIYPVTAGGRIFTFFILMLGLGIVALPSGILASALSQARREMSREDE